MEWGQDRSDPMIEFVERRALYSAYIMDDVMEEQKDLWSDEVRFG